MMLHSAPLAHLTADSIWVYLHENVCIGLQKTHLLFLYAIDGISVIQGHPSSMILAPIESSYGTSY